MSRFKGSPTCLDCGVVHGRPPVAFLCLACRRARIMVRRRTPSYRAMQTRWNRSAKAKRVKGRWYDRHRVELLRRAKARHQAMMLKRGPKQVRCHAWPCTNPVVRIKASRRQFCDDCARVFYGAKYVSDRSARSRSTKWRAA